jgi:hypothetical protein
MQVNFLSIAHPSAKEPHKAAQRTAMSRAAAVHFIDKPRALISPDAADFLTYA